jgi:hypothetical protein
MESRQAELLAAFSAIAAAAFMGFTTVSIVQEATGRDGRLAFEVGLGSGMAMCGLTVGAGVLEGRYRRKWGRRWS